MRNINIKVLLEHENVIVLHIRVPEYSVKSYYPFEYENGRLQPLDDTPPVVEAILRDFFPTIDEWIRSGRYREALSRFIPLQIPYEGIVIN